MRTRWAKEAFFYHIYPLGLTGAPFQQEEPPRKIARLNQIVPWLDHMTSLGATALYLGPIFQSMSHGYDTIDYFQIDQRLGDHSDFVRLTNEAHQRGLRLVLDAVFNHVGRYFWAFRDVLDKGAESDYCDWFENLRFGLTNPLGDPFVYEGWQGHLTLVKLNIRNQAVAAHLLSAVGSWINDYNIDGLRLDAADCMDLTFLKQLRDETDRLKPDFWLMGEVVHGDYRQWANPDVLDSTTNYEAYKGLYSSLVDQNYFEIAHTLQRQFGPEGLYRHLHLYQFVDNHDVNRAASHFAQKALLYPLYLLLFTMPGIPSVYYGSEWGIQGVKGSGTDETLRPALNLNRLPAGKLDPDLPAALRQLADLRRTLTALVWGDYQEVYVAPRQFAFLRRQDREMALVALNSSPDTVEVTLRLDQTDGRWVDRLNIGEEAEATQGSLQLTLRPYWGRIMQKTS